MTQEIHSSQQPCWRNVHLHSGATFSAQHESEQDSAEGDVAVMEGRPKLKSPPRFAVVLLNDDYTTMEFVIEVLRRFFHKSGEDAMQIMMLVHQKGEGVAGVYSYDIAETKAYQVHEYARANGFPLKCVVKEAD
jgi:ATP-dependent Clp protease adaptor protein ClpS